MRGQGSAGEQASRASDHERAAHAFREALHEDPEDRTALRGLIRALFEVGRYDEAVSFCRQSLQLVPSDALPHLMLGKIAAAQRRFAEAEAELKVALELDPGSVEALHALGAVQLTVGDYPGAMSSFAKAVELGPESAQGHLLLGTAYQYAGRHGEAVQEHTRAFQMKRSVSSAGLLFYAFCLRHRLLAAALLLVATLVSIVTGYAPPGIAAFAFLFLLGAINFVYGSRRRALALWLIDLLLVALYLLARATAG